VSVKVVGKARRARDRDLERSLEAGDFNALEEGQASVVLQPDTSSWNPHRKGAADTKQEVCVQWYSLELSSQIAQFRTQKPTSPLPTGQRIITYFTGEDCFT